jgi:ferric-dicitrate binding protein FerR (iron transport regulator)
MGEIIVNISILFRLGVLGVVFFIGGFGAEAFAADARVVDLTGMAWRTVSAKDGTRAETPLKAGDGLSAGESFRTGPKTLLRMKLGDDVAILVKSSSRARLALNDGKDWEVDLENGQVLSAIKNPEKRPNHFSLHTHAATMGVRGTAFFVSEQKGKPTYVCTCHGTVEIRDGKGKVLREVTTTHHESPLNLATPIVASTEEPNHTDAEIAILENLLK